MSDVNTVTSVEQDGRVLSGAGASVEQLESVMERHAPESEPAGGTTPTEQAVETGVPPQTPAPDEKPTRGRQRFADLTRERDEAKAEAAAAKAEREALARERDELKARTPAAQTPEPAPVKTPAPSQPAERFTFPEYVDYATEHPDVSYSAWELERLQAFSDWKDARTDIDGRVSQALAQQRAAQDMRATIEQTHVKGREVYKDFDAVLKSGPGAAVDLGPTEAQARARVAAIYRHPQTEHLQYAIMKDGELAKRLAALDDIGFGVELARIVPGASAPVRQSAAPPAPYTPVNGGNSATTATASSELAKKGFDFDRSGYREKRAAERGMKARR